MIIAMRRVCYGCGICKVCKLDVPVMVVGNITVGGTGKTPLVIWLAKFLQERGHRPGIISRGYGRAGCEVSIVTATSVPDEVGDEAVMIARNAKCPMVVGPSRVAAAQKLLETNSCDVIISDDGLQHYALARDCEIVVIDGERNLGNGLCLPAGPLRESAVRLQHVDFIIKNIGMNDVCNNNSKKTSNGSVDLPVYSMCFIPDCFCKVCDVGANQEQIAVQDLINFCMGKTCHAVAGIGNPARFFQQLRVFGLQIQEHIFPDHHAYVVEDFDFVGKDEIVIMTEKDAVKCRGFAQENWWYLRISAKPEDSFVVKLRRLLTAGTLFV